LRVLLLRLLLLLQLAKAAELVDHEVQSLYLVCCVLQRGQLLLHTLPYIQDLCPDLLETESRVDFGPLGSCRGSCGWRVGGVLHSQSLGHLANVINASLSNP
jgi:hypothetical protein